MATGFQSLLDRASEFLEEEDGETVTIAGFPVPLPANVSGLVTGYNYGENNRRLTARATLEIRLSRLAALAPGVPDPKTGDRLVVRGKTYAVETCTRDTTSLTVLFGAFA